MPTKNFRVFCETFFPRSSALASPAERLRAIVKIAPHGKRGKKIRGDMVARIGSSEEKTNDRR